MDQREFEKELMDFILRGDDSVLDELRNQYQNSQFEPAIMTGAGFITHLRVKPEIAPAANGKTFQIGGVYADFESIQQAFGFILFIEKGYLSFLEGYTLSSDIWPGEYSHVKLEYNGPGGKRDLEKLRKAWS